MNLSIKGNYKKCIFNSESGFLVGLFRVKEVNSPNIEEYLNHTITFTGYFPELIQDETYIFHGKFIEHDKYGKQFQVDSYERVLPEEKDSIVEFLTSGLFKGIGEKTALKIVSVLGKDTLNTILNNPNNLLLIQGISSKQIDILHNTLKQYQASYQSIVSLNEIGFSTRDSMLIYNKYKDRTLSTLNNNIYLFTEDLPEITFKKIDTIALKNNMKKDDIRRIKAAICYVIDEVCNLVGHSYLESYELFNYTIRALGNNIAESEYLTSLEELKKETKIVVVDDKYYLAKMYMAEVNITKRCGYLTRKSDNYDKNLDKLINEVSKTFKCHYNNEQIEAIKLSYIKNFLIVTGGPGTGKTTIIKAIVELYRRINKLSYESLNNRIALLAPTGRASKRISESTRQNASTIHRFLKWNKETDTFQINEYNKSNVDFVIIDEFSMVDTYLFDSLLKGLRYDAKIVLVGDYNQLPSVGAGELLKDMIESNTLTTVMLKELYRQKENSNIISLAYQINDNYLDQTIFNQDSDLTFIYTKQTDIVPKIKEIVTDYKKKLDTTQVLAPMYKTYNGIDIINHTLREMLNPKKKNTKQILINDVTYQIGDKVIQLSNMPDENVFNGDIGYICDITTGSKKEVYINFDGNCVRYTPTNFQKFKHAYAISIHKSQGSEFDTVIVPLSLNYGKMLYRKLIYTAVTRAKKKLILIGEVEALEKAIENNNTNLRKTTLKDMLIENIMYKIGNQN